MAGAYRPRDGTAGVLHGVVRDHLEAFLAEIAARCLEVTRGHNWVIDARCWAAGRKVFTKIALDSRSHLERSCIEGEIS